MTQDASTSQTIKLEIMLWIENPTTRSAIYNMLMKNRGIPVALCANQVDARSKFRGHRTAVVILQLPSDRTAQFEFFQWARGINPQVKFLFLLEQKPANQALQKLESMGATAVSTDEGLAPVLWKVMDLYGDDYEQ